MKAAKTDTPDGKVIVVEPSRKVGKTLALSKATSLSPMEMLQEAVSKNMSAETIKSFMDLRDRWEASEARKAYMEAVAAFKADPPKVYKDRLNKQYGSKYSSLANLVNTVNVSLSEHGLNARWDYKQGDVITVTCILSHVMGHSEEVALSGPPDESGSKNKLQQIKSTITYLKIATFEAVTGIASEEGNADDDANSAGLPRLSKEQADAIRAKINDIGADAAERAEILNQFLTYRKVDSLEEIAAQAFDDCIRALNARKGKVHGK